MAIQRPTQSGATAPVTLIMLGIIGLVGILTLLFVRGSTVAAHRQYYNRLATSGASSALNFAQEKFDEDPFYAGTREFTLVANPDYRVTISAEVVSTSLDGLAKTVRGTGTVYVTDVSETKAYTYDIKTRTLHTYAKQKTPGLYGPLAWYDAADAATIRRAGSPSQTVTSRTTYGSAEDQTRDTVEEQSESGIQTDASWKSPDLELDACDPAEYDAESCDAGTTKKMQAGVLFRNVTVPNAASVLAATLAMRATYVSPGNATTYQVCGIYHTGEAAQVAPFTATTAGQLNNLAERSVARTGACAELKTGTVPPSGVLTADVTGIIAEITRQEAWGGPGSDFSLGFVISYQSGDGQVTVAKDGLALTVSHGPAQPFITEAEPVGEWWDKSPRANHARTPVGQATAPTYKTDGVSGRNGLSFKDTLLEAVVEPAAGIRDYTVLAVLTPKGRPQDSISESFALGTFDSLTKSTFPLLLHGNGGDSFGARPWPAGYAIDTSSASFTCGGKNPACSDAPIVLSATTSVTGATVTTSIRANGHEQAAVSTPLTEKQSLNFDALSIGGSRATATAPATFTDGMYHELIIYDKKLSCREVAALENHLRSKWNLGSSEWVDSCPVQQIPLL